jgi:hypothetical protein
MAVLWKGEISDCFKSLAQHLPRGKPLVREPVSGTRIKSKNSRIQGKTAEYPTTEFDG